MARRRAGIKSFLTSDTSDFSSYLLCTGVHLMGGWKEGSMNSKCFRFSFCKVNFAFSLGLRSRVIFSNHSVPSGNLHFWCEPRSTQTVGTPESFSKATRDIKVWKVRKRQRKRKRLKPWGVSGNSQFASPSPSFSHLLASMSGICQPQKFFTLPWPLFRRTQHSLSLKMSMTGVTISELASITSGSVKKHNSRHGGPPLEGSWSRLLAGSWLPFWVIHALLVLR